jgi:DNA-binding response OmpR family regulator
VYLTLQEYRLPCHLVANASQVLAHSQLLAAAWGTAPVERNHCLRVSRVNLCRNLKHDPAQQRQLTQETGAGYWLLHRAIRVEADRPTGRAREPTGPSRAGPAANPS